MHNQPAKHRHAITSTIIAAALTLTLTALPTHAINLDLIFDTDGSEYPDFDPDASGLQSLFNHAEFFYEDVFKDIDTTTIRYRYEDMGGNTLGFATLSDPTTGESIRTIRIDTRVSGVERNWFIDPTPTTDSEFDMAQILWRDPENEPADWYNNFTSQTPDTFEVAYAGTAIDQTPDNPAEGALDMLSIVFHEIGHLILGDGTDGEYPINPTFIFNTTLAVETANPGSDNHIENTSANMTPSLTSNIRLRPSHTDLLAMATKRGYTTIDIPRREFYGGTNYNNPANWTGNRTPEGNDDAFIRAAQGPGTPLTATLSQPTLVRNLTVAEGSDFNTDNFLLLVSDTLTVDDTNTDVNIEAGGHIDATQVLILNDAQLRLSNGTLTARDITIGTSADLIGGGTVNLDNLVSDLINNGRITAIEPTLVFNSDNDVALNLDGSDENGLVQAIAGSIVFNSALTDPYSNNMTIGPSRSIHFNGSVAFDAGSELVLDGSGSDTATVEATHIVMQLNSVLRADGPGAVDALVTLEAHSIAEGADNGSSIAFNRMVTFQGGRILGLGLASINNDAVVQQNTQIDITTIDLDGSAGNSNITINPHATLEITSDHIDTGDDGYDGTLNVNGGTLEIQPDWRLDNALILNETAGTPATLDGPGQLTVHLTAQLTTNGDAVIDAPLLVLGNFDVGQFGFGALTGVTEANEITEFSVNSNVNIETGSTLILNAPTTYRGGTHTGVGTLRWNGDVTIAEDTDINVVNFDWDGDLGTTTTTVNPNRTLNIASSTIDTALDSPMNGTINLTASHLNVLTDWQLAGQINTSPFVFSTTTPSISGTGGLTLNPVGEIIITGNANINTPVNSNGLITADSGLTAINDTITFNPSSSTVTSLTSETLDDSTAIELNGETTYNGGSFTGPGILRQNADATVTSTTTINVGRFDADGNTTTPATINLHADLTINAIQLDEPEGLSTFNRHDGFFNLNSGTTLTVNLPSRPWVANGALTLGNNGAAPADINGSRVTIGNGSIPVSVITHGFARFNTTTTFNSDTFLAVPTPTDRLELNAPATFRGGIYFGDGTLAVNHTANIQQDTTFDTAQIDLDGQSPGDHRLLIQDDTTLTINAHTIDTDDAAHDDPIELRPGAQLIVNTDTTWTLGPQGSLLLNEPHPAAASVAGQNLTSSGLIRGNGTFQANLSNNGTLQPGLSAGRITVQQTYAQTTNGVMHLEIAGTSQAAEYDHLRVLGNARLAGTLIAELIDGHTPEYGDRHVVINAASITNTFDTHTGLLVDTALALAPLYSPTQLSLRATIPGDLNFDDAVNIADLSELALYFNTAAPFYDPATNTNAWQLGDFNTDGTVTTADLSLLALNFGFTLLPDGTTTPPTPLSLYDAAIIAGLDPTTLPAVPEPTTAATLLILISILTTKKP